MFRPKSNLIFVFLPLTLLFLFPACEKTIDEEVIKPVEMMVGQKGKAASLAAVANAQNVRSALMRYPAISPSNEYPGDMDIYDYDTLRQTLSDAGLPQNMAELMWDPAHGINYRSDGTSFNLEVKALSGETIVATPGGVTKN